MALVLAVDDSRFSRSRVVSALKEGGHDVIEAADGIEGFRAVEEHNPDVVVTDLLMPNCDGIEQLRKIRDAGMTVPVIIVSADIQQTSRDMCEELKAFAFLNKPFDKQDLNNKVASALVQTSGV